MNTSPPPLPAKPRRNLSPGFTVCVILLGIMMALLVWHVVWRVGNARAVAQLEKVARERGEPVTLADLAATYPEIPDASNAYVALAEIWQSEDPEFWDAFNTGQPLPEPHEEETDPNVPVFSKPLKMSHTNLFSPESMEAAAKFLSQKVARREKVRAALERPDFRAPIAFEDSYAAVLPYLARMKNEARHLQLDALYKIETAQIDPAITSIEHSTKVGHYLKNDPLLIGQLVRIACHVMTIASAERLLSRRQLTEEQLVQVASVISGLETKGAFKKALLGERVMGWSVFSTSSKAQRSIADPSEDFSPRDASDSIRFSTLIGLAAADKRLMGETYQKTFTCVENPNFATNSQLNEIYSEMGVKAQKFPPKFLTAMLMPGTETAGNKFTRLEVLRRCALTSIGIERYRLKHDGALPEKLDEVPGEFFTATPIDPFNGQPLRYKKLPTGFVIYSV